MNNSELDKKLKSVRVPERTEAYWEDFPAQVRMNLRRAAQNPVAKNFWLPRLAWAGGLAFTAALVFISLQFHPLRVAAVAINQHEQHFRMELAQLDAGLHALMLNTHGMGYLLTEAN